MELKELMRMGFDRAARQINESPAEDEVTAHFIATDGDKLSVYMTPFHGEFEKVLMLAKLRSMFAEHGIIRYAMVCESWTVERHADALPDDRMPSECPDRKERLTVMGVEYGGSAHVYCDIIREGDKRRCGEPQWGKYEEISGRMTTLLPERKMAS